MNKPQELTKSITNKIPLFFFIIVFISSCTENTDSDDKSYEALTHELQKISEQELIHGFSVALVDHEKTLYQKGFGFSDIEEKKPYTHHSIQKVGSVSKVIIGLSLLKAQELGKLNLDDPVNKYLTFDVSTPSFPDEEITIKHLANHTSSIIDTKYYDENVYTLKENNGFNGIEEMKAVFKPSQSKTSISTFLEKILSKDGEWYLEEGFSTFKPGTNHQYSNVGAALAALILEKATGESYSNFTSKHIFQPLEMSSAGWSFETVDASHISNLYYGNKKIPDYRLQSFADGGLFTSTHDLSLLLRELIKGQSGTGKLLTKDRYTDLFGPSSISSSTDSVRENPVFTVRYDSCIFMGKTPKGYYGHTGGDFGLVSLMFFNAKDRFGRILTVNTHIEGDEEKILNQLWEIWNKLEDYQLKLNESK